MVSKLKYIVGIAENIGEIEYIKGLVAPNLSMPDIDRVMDLFEEIISNLDELKPVLASDEYKVMRAEIENAKATLNVNTPPPKSSVFYNAIEEHYENFVTEWEKYINSDDPLERVIEEPRGPRGPQELIPENQKRPESGIWKRGFR